MKILFKGFDEKSGNHKKSILSEFGITNCYLKYLQIDNDSKNIIKKAHHHNGFEIHIIEKGEQVYESKEQLYKINGGEFLIIPPLVKHKVISSLPGTSKFSFTFNMENKDSYLTLFPFSGCFLNKISPKVEESLKFIIEERENKGSITRVLIENRVFETIILLFRMMGLQEPNQVDNIDSEDFRISIAKQYINDNIEIPLSVSDISEYCYLSQKQITRLFIKHEGMPPSKYIKKQRAGYIEELLLKGDLSLKAISEKMNFNNEYYFNAFIKKHLGMPPAEYKKMFKS